MDGSRDYPLSEVSKTENDKNDITYMWNLLKMIQMNLYTKQKQIHRRRKQTCDYQRERVGKE